MRATSKVSFSTVASLAKVLPLAAGLVTALSSCGKPPLDDGLFAPKGNIQGVVVYSGPAPCTQRGHVVGAAVLLVFNENLLPPPEGFGTTAQQIQVVGGDALFQGILGELTLDPNSDDIICPAPGTPNVTVSAPWVVGPVDAGYWQVRGFYDYDGDFSPVLKIHNLPTAGDIGGGAIDNTAEALAGAAPKYTTLEVGVKDSTGKLYIPESGSLVDNVTVSLGLELNTPRPIFSFSSVIDERPDTFGASNTPTPPLTKLTDPNAIVIPQDERFATSPTANPLQADKQFIRVVFSPSFPESERSAAAKRPFSLQVEEPFTKFVTFARTDLDGNVVTIPEKAPAPNLAVADMFPQAIFGKLVSDKIDPNHLTAQSSPAVVLQGLVLADGKLTSTLASLPANRQPAVVDSVTVALRPSVICLNPFDVNETVYVVTPELTALDGTEVVDPADLAPKVAKTLGRPNVEVLPGCLPQGDFQTNLVYSTGQAWTMPNEAGYCVGQETTLSNGSCSVSGFSPRQTFTSQKTLVKIGDERESGYCETKYGTNEKYLHGVPRVCLSADEQAQKLV
ncbi:MAG: hypothetical protein U0165_13895 [Polyangiaceae bacterium]